MSEKYIVNVPESLQKRAVFAVYPKFAKKIYERKIPGKTFLTEDDIKYIVNSTLGLRIIGFSREKLGYYSMCSDRVRNQNGSYSEVRVPFVKDYNEPLIDAHDFKTNRLVELKMSSHKNMPVLNAKNARNTGKKIGFLIHASTTQIEFLAKHKGGLIFCTYSGSKQNRSVQIYRVVVVHLGMFLQMYWVKNNKYISIPRTTDEIKKFLL